VAVSVVIPCYNGAAYVGNAVRSALDQTDVSVEVIVIDDGSTDATWTVLEGFGDQIRKVRQANGGPVRARNLGAHLARGTWLAFLDADDEWRSDKLARQLARTSDEVALVYTDRVNFGDCERVNERLSDCMTLWEGDIFELLLLGNVITTSSVIMRRDWFERLGGFTEGFCGVEDWDLWLRYTGSGGKIGVCVEPLTRYRWHPGSVSTNHERMCRERLEVLERALALPRARGVKRSVVRRAYASALTASAWYAAPRRPWKALTWYARACLHWPYNNAVYRQMVKTVLGMA
jgi:glycosyltransferase involved in cell wall biosynthesis